MEQLIDEGLQSLELRILNVELGICAYGTTFDGAQNNCIRQLTEDARGGRMRICPERGVVYIDRFLRSLALRLCSGLKAG